MSTQNPLISVSDIPKTAQPTIEIQDSKRIPLSNLGSRRAKDSHGTIENHIRGICGEFAVAKYLGIPESLDTEIYEDGDLGWDLERNNKKIDVKTVGPHVNNPKLLISARAQIKADYYVLVQELNAHNYRIIGYAPSETVLNADTATFTINHRQGQYRLVHQHELFPILSAKL